MIFLTGSYCPVLNIGEIETGDAARPLPLRLSSTATVTTVPGLVSDPIFDSVANPVIATCSPFLTNLSTPFSLSNSSSETAVCFKSVTSFNASTERITLPFCNSTTISLPSALKVFMSRPSRTKKLLSTSTPSSAQFLVTSPG